MHWKHTEVCWIGFWLAIMSFNYSTSAHSTTTSEGKYRNCGLSKSQISNVEKIMEEAKAAMGETEFTRLPAGWGSSCTDILNFIETKTTHVDEGSKFLENGKPDKGSTLEAMRVKHEKEVSTLQKLVQELKHENNQTKTRLGGQFQFKLAAVETEVNKLKSEIQAYIDAHKKLKLDLIYTHISQGNATSARYHTDNSISAEDIGNLLLKFYINNHQNENALLNIRNYLKQKGAPCSFVEAGLRRIVNEMKRQEQFDKMNILWAGEVAYFCRNHAGTETLLNEYFVHAENILQPLAAEVWNQSYNDSKLLERQVYNLTGSQSMTVRSLTRALMTLFHQNTIRALNVEHVHSFDPIWRYFWEGASSCEARIVVMDELLEHLNGSQLGNDLFFSGLIQHLENDTSRIKFRGCESLQPYMICLLDGYEIDGKVLDNVRESCLNTAVYLK